jgi:hypothetical protein
VALIVSAIVDAAVGCMGVARARTIAAFMNGRVLERGHGDRTTIAAASIDYAAVFVLNEGGKTTTSNTRWPGEWELLDGVAERAVIAEAHGRRRVAGARAARVARSVGDAPSRVRPRNSTETIFVTRTERVALVG